MLNNKCISRVIMGLAVMLTLINVSCEQFEYDSPLPGILEIRLAVKNTRTELLPFTTLDTLTGSQNFFGLLLEEVEAIQPGDLRLPIFASLVAIRRNPDGDFYNALDYAARDSNYVLGVAYAPPGTFTGLDLRIGPLEAVILSFGNGIVSEIPVVKVGFVSSLQELHDTSPFNIPIEEGRTTRVTVTYDMDASLRQRAESFQYTPRFYVSSVQVY